MRLVRFPALFAALLLSIAACSGDSRPFTEAVEVRSLDLRTLTIQPPVNFDNPLVLNINQSLQMNLSGLNGNAEAVSLSTVGRSWAVSNTAVASISEDGRLRGLSNGTTAVSVSIGGIQSGQFSVTVSDATLLSVSDIVGFDTVRRCEPQAYFARGTFDDNSVRTLDNVSWAVSSATLAELFDTSGVSTQLNAFSASDQLTLTASVGEATSFDKALVVADTLTGLQLSPLPISLEVDQQIRLTATGFYSTDVESVAQSINITPNVQWQIRGDTDFVSVSNVRSSRGLLTGVDQGASVVRAFCGNVEIEATVVVNESGTSGDSTLSFLVGNRLESGPNITLDRIADGLSVPIRVATGSEYDSENDITEEIFFEVTSDTTLTQPIIIDGNMTATPAIRLTAKGDATLSVTRESGDSETTFDPILLTITVD